jgi:hypothetical protein
MDINIRYLLPQFFQLSKSTFLKGKQCALYLHLLQNKPREKTPHSIETLEKFASGKRFEALFKEQFDGAIDLAALLQQDVWSIGAAYTKAALEETAEAVSLFEACFIYNHTLVMTDVCVKDKEGALTIYEVKNGNKLKQVFIDDAAIQYYVVKNLYPRIKAFNIVLNDGEGGFISRDIKTELEAAYSKIEKTVSELLQALANPKAPKISMEPQCHNPYDCEYLAYCSNKK